MPWPVSVIAGNPVFAADINAIINGLSNWQGNVNANAQSLFNVDSITTIGSLHLIAAPTRYYSAAVVTTPGWAEFTVEVRPGASVATDVLAWVYNRRATAGAADDWGVGLSLATSGGLTLSAPQIDITGHLQFRANYTTFPGVVHEWLGGANQPYAAMGQITSPVSFALWTDAINTPSTSRSGGLTLRGKWMIQPLCAETYGPDFALLQNNDMLAYITSANNTLVFAVRTTSGVLKLGTVALA